MTLTALLVLAGAGWLLAAAGLGRGPAETARTAALTAHALTPFGALLVNAILGYGLLYTLIALTAEWWALSLATLGRPRRLTDPASGGLTWLVAWLAGTAALTYGLAALIV
ncbi:hypothetical protein SAMN04489712_106272 [Thermomonospora echinospora]|uniref:Uncharacterized protein n=1 Tax=Thermomonospora echinospora TaxID=1992 RepID=A0A1H6B521_9ACTN|nr:hypothetical protein [Thermomonospora echinospora]SEG55943.1 hypothetical protein SAMN04489712_106272 [Thermomonospora echinospora]